MLWGTSAQYTGSWEKNAKAAIANGATHLLGYILPPVYLRLLRRSSCHYHPLLTSRFNEPDISSQANISPQEAVAAWKTHMQPFAGKAKLCSPAVSNGPNGQPWLDQFMKLCNGCTVDCIAFHIYDSATNIAYFKQYITEMGTRYGKPTWVTEVRRGCCCIMAFSRLASWILTHNWTVRHDKRYGGGERDIRAPDFALLGQLELRATLCVFHRGVRVRYPC